MINIYNVISSRLTQWFGFPKQDTFCQVATIANNIPQLRTMRLHQFTDTGTLKLLTRTTSGKWQQLQACPQITICLAQPGVGQIIVSGNATLKSPECNHSDDEIKTCWAELPARFKIFYPVRDPATELPKDFGIITVITKTWEVLQINPQDYFNSRRTLYTFVDDSWHQQAIKITS